MFALDSKSNIEYFVNVVLSVRSSWIADYFAFEHACGYCLKKIKIESEIAHFDAPTQASMGFTHLSKPISRSSHGEQNFKYVFICRFYLNIKLGSDVELDLRYTAKCQTDFIFNLIKHEKKNYRLVWPSIKTLMLIKRNYRWRIGNIRAGV